MDSPAPFLGVLAGVVTVGLIALMVTGFVWTASGPVTLSNNSMGPASAKGSSTLGSVVSGGSGTLAPATNGAPVSNDAPVPGEAPAATRATTASGPG